MGRAVIAEPVKLLRRRLVPVRRRSVRTLLSALAILLPARWRRALYVHLLGHSIHPTARVGRSFIDVQRMEIGPRVYLGSLNVIRNLELLQLDEAASIASLNLINAVRRHEDHFRGVERRLELVLRFNARIQMMHFIDCTDRIELGERSNIGGCWTQVLTHSWDMHTNRQAASPITIGTRSIVATRCTLLPGAVVPEYSIVAACSLVRGPLADPATFYAGSPVKPVRSLDTTMDFFTSDSEYRT